MLRNRTASLLLIAVAVIAFHFAGAEPKREHFQNAQASTGSADLSGSAARFYWPGAAAVDGAGNVYVADTQNGTVRKATADGVVSTLAGLAGNYGSADGTGGNARFYGPQGIAVDATG